MRQRVPVWAADAALIAVTLIWGVTFPVVKAALAYSSPLLFNATRMSLAALVLLLLWRPWRGATAGAWRAGAILGLLLAAGYAFQTAGLALTTPATSAFITGLSTVLVPLLLAAFWRRRLPAGAWIGALLATAGLALLVSVSAPAGPHSRHAGELLTLACAACFAFHIICLGEWAPRFPFRHLAALQIAFCALITWAALPVVEAPRWHPAPALLAALAVTALLATALAFSVQSWAQQFTPATHTAVVFALEPVFAWIASSLGWHERFTMGQSAGAGLILLAILAVEIPRPRAPKGSITPLPAATGGVSPPDVAPPAANPPLPPAQ